VGGEDGAFTAAPACSVCVCFGARTCVRFGARMCVLMCVLWGAYVCAYVCSVCVGDFGARTAMKSSSGWASIP
jgi:hypothetical protein